MGAYKPQRHVVRLRAKLWEEIMLPSSGIAE
jgi:hypothetical protein